MTAQSGVISWLKTISKEDTHSAGEKAVQLGELLQESFPVPDGFVVTTLAYFHFLHENNLIPKITQLLQTVNYNQPESVMQVAAHIQKMIVSTKFSDTFTSEISHAYHKLCGIYTNAPVTIILPHETLQNIHGETNILQKIKQSFASIFTPDTLINRHQKHMNHFQEGIALVIQKMVDADISGVILTSNPITRDRTNNIIEAIDDTTDHYVVAKNGVHTILEKNVAGSKQKISDQQIFALSELGTKLEKHLYFPQEIHWAIERNTIYIVQTKPLTIQKASEGESPIAHKLPLLLKGIPAARRIATGVVKKITTTKDLEHIAHGDIVVAADIIPLHSGALKKAAGFVTDRGGRTSPIALFAREWGIPAVIGTTHATTTVKNGQILTIDGSKGEIYSGSPANHPPKKHKTHLFELRSDAMPPFSDFSDGALLIQSPTDRPSESLFLSVCGQFGSRPVLYRLSDGIAQGTNPLIGSHGSHHLLHHPELLKLELQIIREAKNDSSCKNLAVLLPFVRSVQEVISLKNYLNEYGLTRSETFKIWIEVATPSSLMLLSDYLAAGIDGIVFDTDTLAMLMLGTDKNDNAVAHAFDPTNKAMVQLLENAVKSVQTHGIPLIMYGHSLLHHPSLIEKLISSGVTGIAVESNHIDQIRKDIIETERRLIENQYT